MSVLLLLAAMNFVEDFSGNITWHEGARRGVNVVVDNQVMCMCWMTMTVVSHCADDVVLGWNMILFTVATVLLLLLLLTTVVMIVGMMLMLLMLMLNVTVGVLFRVIDC